MRRAPIRTRSPLLWLALAFAGLAACDSPTAPEDAGLDAQAGDAGGGDTCERDADCDDDLFCNGEERCVDAACETGEAPCAAAECSEDDDRCEQPDCDSDGDGHLALECEGDDCDDEDPTRYPGNTEVCDANDNDEDCDVTTFGFRDQDGDGFPDAQCCNGEACGNDCNDQFPAARPGAVEACDTVDNDCDGLVDEGATRTFYIDSDNDSFGAEGGATMMACSPPAGYVENDEDCADGDNTRHPLASEVCEAGCIPGATCVDENCDGVALSGEECGCTAGETQVCCGSGIRTCDSGTGRFGECSITPTTEACNGGDDDCDGETDEHVTMTCYPDPDQDGYAAAGAAGTERCVCPVGETNREPTGAAIDCGEGDGDTHPGAVEACDRIDNDCSTGGGADPSEDMDNDGYAAVNAPCSGGLPRTDCNDGESDVHPGQTTNFSTPIGGSSSCIGNMTLGCWDYDCNGVLFRQYRITPFPVCDIYCTENGTCGRAGYESPVDCGVTETLRRCQGACPHYSCEPEDGSRCLNDPACGPGGCTEGCGFDCYSCGPVDSQTAQGCR